jgi:hypothetical protein
VREDIAGVVLDGGLQDRVVAQERVSHSRWLAAHSDVEDSMSVNRNVTVPVGSQPTNHHDRAWTEGGVASPRHGTTVAVGKG